MRHTYTVTVTRPSHPARVVTAQTARDAARLAYCFAWTAYPDTPLTVPDLLVSRKQPRVSWAAGDRSLHVTVERA
jgi:hypothetical protein